MAFTFQLTHKSGRRTIVPATNEFKAYLRLKEGFTDLTHGWRIELLKDNQPVKERWI